MSQNKVEKQSRTNETMSVSKLLDLICHTDHDHDALTNVDEFLFHYPLFRFNIDDKCWRLLFKDIIKCKKQEFDKINGKDDALKLQNEHQKLLNILLQACNYMKRIVSVIAAKDNKKLIMETMGILMNDRFVSGGDMTPKTKRIVMIYEKEGEVKAKTRSRQILVQNVGKDQKKHHKIATSASSAANITDFSIATTVNKVNKRKESNQLIAQKDTGETVQKVNKNAAKKMRKVDSSEAFEHSCATISYVGDTSSAVTDFVTQNVIYSEMNSSVL